ncbi:MAG: GNAT family N-acetyltransferase [Actinobacteria bacterium]|nr:GNAT family N-acetyltransferase [Actinomycetota bacterium]
MARIEVRDADPGDLPDIAEVALATGQDEEWGGADPAYMGHLLAHGRVVVGVSGGSVIAFGATRQLGTSADAVSMLCDLFVHPRMHGRGGGRALLAELWQDGGRRMTFSSLHAHALPLYTSFGLDAWWPLLYLGGRVDALTVPAGWQAEASTAATVSALELAWTSVDRSADHFAWARRPSGASVRARRGGQVMAAAAVGGAGGEYGVTHLALAPSAGDGDAAAAVLAVLARLEPESGLARVCLPGPHPAVRTLLAAGWRVAEFDLFMATEPELLDPRRAVPSSALA